MRFLKLASAKNPLTDYVLLNGGWFDEDGKEIEHFTKNKRDTYVDVNGITRATFKKFTGFLCTQFQTLGISRNIDFLTIKNRNIPVDNKPVFKRYGMTIEVFTTYNEYERKYYELITFLDRNKKDGFRLYYNPYGDGNKKNERYCLCSIEMSNKIEKMQPITLILTQDSLWIGEQNTAHSSLTSEMEGNLFVFDNDNGYYSASFSADANIPNYYCIAFYTGVGHQADINISGYNEVPLNIRIYGHCFDPQILLYRKNEKKPFKTIQVFEEIGEDYYLEINSDILDNGVWEVNKHTGEKRDLTANVDYSKGSPYVYLDNGEYYIRTTDINEDLVVADISWREEYSE